MGLIHGAKVFDFILENLPNWYASTKNATAAVSLADVALAVLYVTRAR